MYKVTLIVNKGHMIYIPDPLALSALHDLQSPIQSRAQYQRAAPESIAYEFAAKQKYEQNTNHKWMCHCSLAG